MATFVLNQIDLQLNKLDGNMNLEEILIVTGNKISQKKLFISNKYYQLAGRYRIIAQQKEMIYSACHF